MHPFTLTLILIRLKNLFIHWIPIFIRKEPSTICSDYIVDSFNRFPSGHPVQCNHFQSSCVLVGFHRQRRVASPADAHPEVDVRFGNFLSCVLGQQQRPHDVRWVIDFSSAV